MSEEMILSIGQVLRGRNSTYRLLETLHAPTVFKAQILDSLAVSSELWGMLAVFNMSAYQCPVRWSKQHWNPPRKPWGENETTISFLGSARAHISAANTTFLNAIRTLVRACHVQMKRPQLRPVWSLNGWSTTCGKYRLNDFVKIQSCPRSYLDQYCRHSLFSRHSKTQYTRVDKRSLSSMAGTDSLDINPNNIFLSDIDSPSPIIKVGDLGNSEFLQSVC